MNQPTDIYSDLRLDEFMLEEDILALVYHDPGDEDPDTWVEDDEEDYEDDEDYDEDYEWDDD